MITDCVQTPPFTSFCMYMAARWFAMALKEAPQSEAGTLWEALEYMQSRLELIKTTRPYTANLIKQLHADLDLLGGELNPTGHIIVKAVRLSGFHNRSCANVSLQTPDDIADATSNASPVNVASNTKTSPIATQPNPQIQSSFAHVRSKSSGVVPEIFGKRPSYLSRAYTDPDPDCTPGSTNSIPASFIGGPTSVPMDDLLWATNTNNEVFTSNYTRAGSAPPMSGLIDMSMMDGMDPTEMHMGIPHSTFGLYSASDASHRPMDLTHSWSSDLIWNSSHG